MKLKKNMEMVLYCLFITTSYFLYIYLYNAFLCYLLFQMELKDEWCRLQENLDIYTIMILLFFELLAFIFIFTSNIRLPLGMILK